MTVPAPASDFDFGQLKKYDPRGKRVWWQVPRVEGDPELQVCHAGLSNKPYTNAVAKHTAKAARKASREVNADTLLAQLATDRHAFPGRVVVGWKGVVNSAGQPVPFSEDACTAYLKALPDWIILQLSNFCGVASNFLDDDMPTDAEIDDQAGE